MSFLAGHSHPAMVVHCRGIGGFSSMALSAPCLSPVRMLAQEERGVPFQVGPAFYRRQSSLARDLGILLAALHRQQTGQLRVLDVMSGCGVRSVRYLLQARADFVWANDACNELMETLALNLSQAQKAATEDFEAREAELERWRISGEDANKLLLGCAVRREYYDLIDVDSFGSDTLCLGPALAAVKHGGLVYLTSTDGFSAGGHRPHNALASYGGFVNPMPYANEIGLRMLIGGAVREAATRNMKIVPVFSNYSYHGPVFRTMLRVEPGKWLRNRNYGFIVYCKLCGQSQDIQFEDLGEIACRCSHVKAKGSLVVSGPLWLGPLHETEHVKSMIELARQWGWIKALGERSRSDSPADMRILEQLLEVMVDESQPGLPSGYIEMHEVGKRGKLQTTPRRNDFIQLLQQEGFVASRSHVNANAVKTNCPMDKCIELARSMNASSQPRQVATSNGTGSKC
ncbi:tRNA (guanine26-N2/guanine27-N2)-dimethyltransferase [Marchantia polymorpha subsp. ruderalis]